ncbi:hypothetical protein [Pendulispora albinea]|uniref:Uncharacterized protein n=1 Tax=Pendulispora albinea TaxID=2741071 RepID=A0ABZ2LN26_9BACT
MKDYVVDFYFPIHRISWREGAKCLPLLLFFEYMVYRVDDVAEDGRRLDIFKTKNEHFDTLMAKKVEFINLLGRLRLYNTAIEREVDMGEQYVRLENKMTSISAANAANSANVPAAPTARNAPTAPTACNAPTVPTAPTALNAPNVIEHADIMRAAELRASDVRLLHCMLFGVLKRPCDEELLSLLWPVEVIADIGNDLDHYADDVDNGNYNTYHMLVKLYRDKAPERVRAEINKYERLFLERLEQYPSSRKEELKSLCSRFYRTHTTTIPEPKLASC